jgi:hypothetical protein
MIDTGDLLTRARQCVACHVGGGGLDVNHGLIAAGHPRLNFEYTAYFNTMPRHWRAPADGSEAADRSARDWLVGQAVSAAAAMNLLAERAGDERTWPELAEYDCFSCHHDLASPSWRQRRGYTGRPGELSWGDWYLSLPRTLAALEPTDELNDLSGLTPAFLSDSGRFDHLRAQMAAVRPDGRAVAAQARAAAVQLTAWSAELSNARLDTDEFSRRLLWQVSRDPLNLSHSSWDAGAQLYLALIALHRATQTTRDGPSPSGRDDEVKRLLTELCDELSYPAVADGSEVQYQSPRDYQPDRFRANLIKLQEELSKP